jgi:hypothetical protein
MRMDLSNYYAYIDRVRRNAAADSAPVHHDPVEAHDRPHRLQRQSATGSASAFVGGCQETAFNVPLPTLICNATERQLIHSTGRASGIRAKPRPLVADDGPCAVPLSCRR